MGRLVCLLLLVALGCGVPVPPGVEELEGRAKQGDPEAVSLLVERLGRGAGSVEHSRVYLILLQVPASGAAPIAAAFADPDPVRREHALALGANLRLDGTADAALRALQDQEFPRRYVAAWALGELGDPTAAPALISALSQGDELVARASARALVKLGGGAVPALLAAFQDLAPSSARYAVRVLGEVGDPRAAPALLTALQQPEQRADAAWAVGKLGLAESGESLLGALVDPDWRVRLEACRALGLLEFSGADADLDRLRTADPVPAVREWAARGLALVRGTPQTFRDARGEERVPDSLYR